MHIKKTRTIIENAVRAFYNDMSLNGCESAYETYEESYAEAYPSPAGACSCAVRPVIFVYEIQNPSDNGEEE